MTRAMLNRLAVAISIGFLAYCWCVAGVGAFKMLTYTGHAKRAPIHFCEGDR